MRIIYFFFETNDFKAIESKLPHIEDGDGEEANIKDFSFSINRINKDNIGLVLEIISDSDISLSIDFEKKKSEDKSEEESNSGDGNNENGGGSKALLIIILLIVLIVIIIGIFFYIKWKSNKQNKDNLNKYNNIDEKPVYLGPIYDEKTKKNETEYKSPILEKKDEIKSSDNFDQDEKSNIDNKI